METKVNYTLVGLFVVVLTTALIVIAFWLAANITEKPYKTYLVYMQESVAGLNINAAVKFNGVNVGYVSNVNVDPKNPELVRLELKIEAEVPITVDTTATLSTQGLTGIANVALAPGKDRNAPFVRTLPGYPYPIIKTTPSLMLRLDSALTELTNNLSSVSKTMKEMLTPENQQAFAQLLVNMSAASEKLPALVTQLNYASAQTTKTMRQGQIAVQALTQQTLPLAYQTFSQLQVLSDQLLSLSQELENNPAMLVRGRALPPTAPGASK